MTRRRSRWTANITRLSAIVIAVTLVVIIETKLWKIDIDSVSKTVLALEVAVLGLIVGACMLDKILHVAARLVRWGEDDGKPLMSSREIFNLFASLAVSLLLYAGFVTIMATT